MPLDKAWLVRARRRRGLLRRRAGGDGDRGQPLHRRGRRRAGRRSTTRSCRSSPTCGRRTIRPPIRRELNSNVITTYKVELRRRRRGLRQGRACVQAGAVAAPRRGAFDRGARHRSPRSASADGGITVHASTQKAHDLQQTLTSLMDFDESLRVVAPDIGGGFGAKLCVYSEDVAVVAAAKLLEPLDQMDRGPPRVFHQRGARARPVLVAGDRGRRRSARCSASAASSCTTPAPTRCRTRTSPTIRPRP